MLYTGWKTLTFSIVYAGQKMKQKNTKKNKKMLNFQVWVKLRVKQNAWSKRYGRVSILIFDPNPENYVFRNGSEWATVNFSVIPPVFSDFKRSKIWKVSDLSQLSKSTSLKLHHKKLMVYRRFQKKFETNRISGFWYINNWNGDIFLSPHCRSPENPSAHCEQTESLELVQLTIPSQLLTAVHEVQVEP